MKPRMDKSHFNEEEARNLALFDNLGVKRDATKEEIEKAFREIVANAVKEKKELGEAKLRELNIAKTYLSDDKTRAVYIKALEKYEVQDGLCTGIEEVRVDINADAEAPAPKKGRIHEVDEPEAQAEGSSKKNRICLIVALILVLFGLIAFAAYFLLTSEESSEHVVTYNFKDADDACFTTVNGVFDAMTKHEDCCRMGWRTKDDTLKMACDAATFEDVYMYEPTVDSCGITRTFTHIDDYTT